MCTTIALKTNNFYFGRNMDLEYNFGEQIVITPRNYHINFKSATSLNTHYSIIGMATVIDNYPLYADAVNEKGLCMAGLKFSDEKFYSKQLDSNKSNITPYEIILWILGQCSNINQVKELLKNTHIVSIPFNDNISSTGLHWHIADSDSSIVVEYMESGIKVYDNPVGVLTNNPSFDFHLNNLALYLNLSPKNTQNVFSEKAGIKAYCNGIGSIGLPGDCSSPSRFSKAAYLILNSKCKNNEDSSISQVFHILDNVSSVRGSIVLENGLDYATTYSSCINANRAIYYYKTYENNQITAIDMWKEDINSSNLIIIPIVEKQQILWGN